MVNVYTQIRKMVNDMLQETKRSQVRLLRNRIDLSTSRHRLYSPKPQPNMGDYNAEPCYYLKLPTQKQHRRYLDPYPEHYTIVRKQPDSSKPGFCDDPGSAEPWQNACALHHRAHAVCG